MRVTEPAIPPPLADPARIPERLARLSPRALRLLHRVQRRARDGVALGGRCWDPHGEARAISALLEAELIELSGDDWLGLVRLAPGLPPPPPVPYDFEEALMPPPDDLEAPTLDLLAVEGDLAALAAAFAAHPPRRTLAGTLDVATLKRVGSVLADPGLAERGRMDAADPRWARALRLLELLDLVEQGEIDRLLRPAPSLREALDRPVAARMHALLCHAVDPDLHPLLAPLRAALRQADDQAVDEVIFLDLLAEQHRDVLNAPWGQVGVRLYPQLPGEPPLPYTRETFDLVEAPSFAEVQERATLLGLLRAAPGVFAATAAGRAWAELPPAAPTPRLILSPDREILAPPGALEPWDRYLFEQLAPAAQRDVVDRHRLSKPALSRWLRRWTLEDALELLRAHAAHGVPPNVEQTLASWARAAARA